MGKKFFLNQECERMRRGDVRPKNEETQANRPYSGLPAPERGAATPAEFSVPNGELGLSLGATYTGDYSQLARRINDGIYVKKLPDTAAGPLKVTYDYTHRTVQAHPHSTQEATFVYGSKPIGATNPKIYKELSDRVHDGIYVKILGYFSLFTSLIDKYTHTHTQMPPARTRTHCFSHTRTLPQRRVALADCAGSARVSTAAAAAD